MNKEIKEILKDLEFASGIFNYTITPDRCTFLKDYITNLQEENKRLSNKLEEEKKIPEKLHLSDYEDTTGKFDYDVLLTINEIIDYLDYLKSKGE